MSSQLFQQAEFQMNFFFAIKVAENQETSEILKLY